MPASERLTGVFSPVVMPFKTNLEADAERLIRQCRWLLGQGVGIAVFGTNSEANSLSVGEKIELLDRLVDAGIDPSRLLPGTGHCAIPDTIRLTQHAIELGCSGVLMLPPFYYKDVSDEGLFRSFAEIIERTDDERLQIILYHIPPVSQVALSIPLIERLIEAYPRAIAGIKDSSGDLANTSAMLDSGWDDFSIFAGSESFLLQTLQKGGAGCISATANINPAAIHYLYLHWQEPDAETLQQRLVTIRNCVQHFPVIPALKSIVAHYSGDSAWDRVRPPLVELTEVQRNNLLTELEQVGFSLSGLADNA